MFQQICTDVLSPAHPVVRHRGATTRELCELFQLNRQVVPRVFGAARLSGQTETSPAYYSRAGVSELLSGWNGRPIPYPDRQLLTINQVRELLHVHGFDVSRDSLNWAHWKKKFDYSLGIWARQVPELRTIKCSTVLRVTQAEALIFLDRWAAYELKKSTA
jgi:hypothetical protein